MLKILRNCKKGFTLLELLVVVLIIGILAGIALPQYKKSVDISRMKAELPNVRAIFNARERCQLANNVRCIDIDDMDINLDYTEKNCSATSCSYKRGDYSLSLPSGSDTIYYGYKGIVNINFYGRSQNYMGFAQIATCYQMNGKNDICLALGGEYIREHPSYPGSNIYSLKF